MGRISIISKERGQGIYKSIDETWEYLNTIVIGDLTENSESIIIEVDNKEIPDSIITVNKEYIYANTPEFITYRVNLKFGGRLQVLLNKHKKEQTKYDLRGFYPEGFKISFEADSEYTDKSLNDPNFNPVFTKKQFLNGQELALLFQALMKNLFSRPEKGYLLFESYNGGGNLFFDKDYYVELKNSINEKYLQGKFAESNAEHEWIQFKNKIDSSENIINPDITNCSVYPVSKND